MEQKRIKNKKVILVTNSLLLRQEVLQHGLDLSKRMDASLEVLHLLVEDVALEADRHFKDILAKINLDEPVGYIQLLNDRGVTTETVEYAKNRRNIFCVILCLKGEGIPPKKGLRQKKFKEVTKLLNCPVVLYTDSQVDK